MKTFLSFVSNPLGLIGSLLLFFIFLFAIFGPYMNPFLPDEIHLSDKNTFPNSIYWFGTDELGRDLFTRCFMGVRISLYIAIVAGIIDLFIGVLWGALSAFSKRSIDNIMMRICDILSSIPYLLMVIMFIVVIGPGLLSIVIALSCVGWINMARITRAKVLEIKNLDYIKASIALGASNQYIIKKHLIPNAIGPIIATMMLTIPNAIFIEAFLSFLGLGIQAPYASLGSMANEGLNAMRYFTWRLFIPSFLICIIMLAFNLIGNSLRESLDPRIQN